MTVHGKLKIFIISHSLTTDLKLYPIVNIHAVSYTVAKNFLAAIFSPIIAAHQGKFLCSLYIKHAEMKRKIFIPIKIELSCII